MRFAMTLQDGGFGAKRGETQREQIFSAVRSSPEVGADLEHVVP